MFFIIELFTRRVEIAGITPNPNEARMMQIGGNLTNPDDGCLSHKRFLIMDRDSKYSPAFRTLLNHSDIEIVHLPPRSPNLNAYAERFAGSIEDERVNRMIFFGERSSQKATREFVARYYRERKHQGIENRLIDAATRRASASDAVECSDRLGGMLRFYHRAVA